MTSLVEKEMSLSFRPNLEGSEGSLKVKWEDSLVQTNLTTMAETGPIWQSNYIAKIKKRATLRV